MPASIKGFCFFASGAALIFQLSWMKFDKREVRGLPERVRDTIVLIECSKSLVVWLHGSLACQRLLPQMCVHYTQGTTHLAF